MSKFIKLPIINCTNIEGDTDVFVRVDSIMHIHAATQMDRRQRNEVRAVIMDTRGQGMATSMTAQAVADAVDEASL